MEDIKILMVTLICVTLIWLIKVVVLLLIMSGVYTFMKKTFRQKQLILLCLLKYILVEVTLA